MALYLFPPVHGVLVPHDDAKYDEALYQQLDVLRNAVQTHTVEYGLQQENAQQRLQGAAASAGQRCAAEDDHRNHRERGIRAGDGRTRVHSGGQEDASDAGAHRVDTARRRQRM